MNDCSFPVAININKPNKLERRITLEIQINGEVIPSAFFYSDYIILLKKLKHGWSILYSTEIKNG